MFSIKFGKHKRDFKDAPLKKKIGFFSSIIMVICSSVGAGIFVKNREILSDVHGAVIFAVLAWTIAIVGILGLTLAIGEICSGSGHKNDQGFIGWVRAYCNKFLYLGSKNFMTYLHLPIYYLVLPMYLVMVLQQAFGFQVEWWQLLLISLAISSYFIISAGISTKIANIQSWVSMAIKFAPIMLAIAGGFALLGVHWNEYSPQINWTNFRPYDDPDQHTNLFKDQSATLGIMAAIPAIFFAFDGFYATAGIQTSMREPRKVATSMAVGVAIVSLLDMLITLALVLTTYDKDGQATGIMGDLNLPPNVIKVFEVAVAIGVTGIINGFAHYGAKYYNDLIVNNEIPFAKKLKRYVKQDSVFIGVVVGLVIMWCFSIVFCLIGSFAFVNLSHYTLGEYGNKNVSDLYSFCDVIGNWNAVLAFVCILFAVIGCLVNRFTKKIQVERKRWFVLGAIVSTAILGCALIYTVVDACGNIAIVYGYWKGGTDLLDIDLPTVIGTFVQLGIFVLFVAIMFVPAAVRCAQDKKHKQIHVKDTNVI